MAEADALWDKVQIAEENLHEILRLETAHIDPKQCPCNCTTDMPKPHLLRRGEILKLVSDTG